MDINETLTELYRKGFAAGETDYDSGLGQDVSAWLRLLDM